MGERGEGEVGGVRERGGGRELGGRERERGQHGRCPLSLFGGGGRLRTARTQPSAALYPANQSDRLVASARGGVGGGFGLRERANAAPVQKRIDKKRRGVAARSGPLRRCANPLTLSPTARARGATAREARRMGARRAARAGRVVEADRSMAEVVRGGKERGREKEKTRVHVGPALTQFLSSPRLSSFIMLPPRLLTLRMGAPRPLPPRLPYRASRAKPTRQPAPGGPGSAGGRFILGACAAAAAMPAPLTGLAAAGAGAAGMVGVLALAGAAVTCVVVRGGYGGGWREREGAGRGACMSRPRSGARASLDLGPPRTRLAPGESGRARTRPPPLSLSLSLSQAHPHTLSPPSSTAPPTVPQRAAPAPSANLTGVSRTPSS